jgi:DNA-binding NarL/FixJ family response regulator
MIEALTPRQRELVALRCGPEELTHAEVAHRLRISSNTVKVHSATILDRLQVKTFQRVCTMYGQHVNEFPHPGGLRPEEV